jgi:kumamolisin
MVSGRKVELAGSYRGEPEHGAFAGECNPDHEITVTLYLKHPAIEELADAHRVNRANTRLLSRRMLARRRAAEYRSAADSVARFASRHDLAVKRRNLARRSIMVRGKAAKIAEAFGTSLQLFHDGRRQFCVRSGPLYVPEDIAPFTRAVLGLDQRPQVQHRLESLAGAGLGPGLWPSQIAALYDIPVDIGGVDQCVGVIALGGGYLASDLERLAKELGRSPPIMVDRPSEDASNVFGINDRADAELALDIQIIYGVAPSAKIVVYFSANTTGSLVAALHDAVHDDKNRPQVLTISWGSSERTWTDAARAAAQAAFQDAKDLRVSVVAASGDSLATGGLIGKGANVFFPASSPYVLGCGGTAPALSTDSTAIQSEAVWNEGGIGTGGGISDVFPVPDYQSGFTLPASVNGGRPGRGVPDVAAAASPIPGYRER